MSRAEDIYYAVRAEDWSEATSLIAATPAKKLIDFKTVSWVFILVIK